MVLDAYAWAARCHVCVLNSPIVQGIHIVNHCDIYERFPENCGALPQYPGEALGHWEFYKMPCMGSLCGFCNL